MQWRRFCGTRRITKLIQRVPQKRWAGCSPLPARVLLLLGMRRGLNHSLQLTGRRAGACLTHLWRAGPPWFRPATELESFGKGGA